jgi:hypothetical protein
MIAVDDDDRFLKYTGISHIIEQFAKHSLLTLNLLKIKFVSFRSRFPIISSVWQEFFTCILMPSDSMNKPIIDVFASTTVFIVHIWVVWK